MKATLETVTGVTINRDIDTADSPMGIIRKFYEEDATAATQIFSNQRAIDQLMDGHIDEAKSAFELLSIEGDSIKAYHLMMMPRTRVPQPIAETIMREAHGLFTKAFFAANMTFIAATRYPDTPVQISGIAWSGGRWRDIGEEQTMEILMRTDLGSAVDVFPGMPLTYRQLHRPADEG